MEERNMFAPDPYVSHSSPDGISLGWSCHNCGEEVVEFETEVCPNCGEKID